MAKGDPSPTWPLATSSRRITGDFGDPRVGTAESERPGAPRIHVAEDLPAPQGTAIFAPEAGRVVDVRPTFYKGSGLVLVQGDSGLVYVLGEIDPESPMVSRGDRVAKGQAVARVGRHNQLHFETYRAGTRTTSKWWAGEAAPPSLLDPTDYLRAAAKSHTITEAPSLPPLTPSPDPEPIPRGQPQPSGSAWWLLVAVVVLNA